MKLREVELKLKVMTSVPLSILQRANKYDKITMLGIAGHTVRTFLQAQAHVIEPWDVKGATHAHRR